MTTVCYTFIFYVIVAYSTQLGLLIVATLLFDRLI